MTKIKLYALFLIVRRYSTPYPNFHSARVFTPLSGDIITVTKNIAPGINVILQRKKDEDSLKTQAYRFDKNRFTPEEAKNWLKKHDVKYISFEPASEPSKEETRKEVIKRITKELAGAIIK